MVLKRKATAQHGVSSSYSGFINIAVGLHSAGQKIRHAEKRNFLMDAAGGRAGAGAGGGKYLL